MPELTIGQINNLIASLQQHRGEYHPKMTLEQAYKAWLRLADKRIN